jgi:hypothetical protein
MENNENSTETPATETAAQAPEAAAVTENPADPSIIGRLTPEEQNAMMRIRAESQQLLAKVGEHEILKLRILARVEELDDQGQSIISGVTKRLGLPEGTPWHGLQDGTIRLVNKPVPAQTQEEGGGADAS